MMYHKKNGDIAIQEHILEYSYLDCVSPIYSSVLVILTNNNNIQ